MRTKPDGVRRIAELKKGKLTWHIEIPDTGSDEHLKEVVETQRNDEIPAIVDQNGGGWKLNGVLNEFPHETEAREALEAQARQEASSE